VPLRNADGGDRVTVNDADGVPPDATGDAVVMDALYATPRNTVLLSDFMARDVPGAGCRASRTPLHRTHLRWSG